jgi:pyruvate dehydrogenase E2 component (dihydrolipoamide acetyltransferase)
MSFKHTVVMPKMSMTMETGELIGFHVAEGQEVKAGDVLFEVMTDKIDMEVEAPADGKIEKLLAAPGAVLEVGKPVLTMETATQVLSFEFDGPAESAPAVIEAPVAPVISEPVIAPTANLKSVPAARKLAADKGIDLQKVKPTGPHATITYEDVHQADIDPNIAKRKVANKGLIAKGIEMTLAIPQTSFSRTVDFDLQSIGGQSAWHAKLLKAWSQVLKSHGVYGINSTDRSVGVALIIESKYGSALPVFKDPELMEESVLAQLVSATTDQAKSGKVPLAMLNGATTTIFDLTHYQMAGTKPTLFPNQSTGLTVGVDTTTGEKNRLALSLTIDLRALDFYDGAALLADLVDRLN